MAEPINEKQRQRALDAYRVLDSLPEVAFDDIATLAAEICETPIALVSLIDRDRQWLKARLGMDATETARNIAFCDHAIREPGQLMEVADASRDVRFKDNPLVTDDQHIRFYAGMPLVTPDGAAIGTVCVLDHEARQLTAGQKTALACLARLTMTLLDMRHRETDQARSAVLAVAHGHAAQVPGAPRTVVLFELQDFAGAVRRKGERNTERQLQQLEERLNTQLESAAGDRVSRVTGSPELIVVLRGHDNAKSLAGLLTVVAGFERETSLRVLPGHADADAPDERIGDVYLRADAALSAAKDGLRLAA